MNHPPVVLITGGAGLIGSHITDLLLEGALGVSCEKILIYDNLTRGCRSNLESALRTDRVELIEEDILDLDTLHDAMRGVDLVFHQAAIRITHCAQDPRLAHNVLATGTLNVLEAAVNAGVKKVVAASSASIYGMAEEFPTTEHHHSYNNQTLYGALKVYNEGLLRSFFDMYQLPYVALRYFNVYGPRMDIYGKYTEVLIRWMERIAANQSPIIFGDGQQTMDFIHVRDIARANILAARSSVQDEVFNIATGTETSLLDLAAMLQKVMGSELPIEFGPARAVNPVYRRLADVQKAKKLLGFTAEMNLMEGLRDLVTWWKSQKEPLLVQSS